MTSYIELYKKKKLEKIRDLFWERLKNCNLCPRNCKVNRVKEEVGFCKTKTKAVVSSYFLHFGEEPELVGRGGSGTIFFSYCNLGCLYCQNYTISWLGEGREVDAEELAKMMLILQRKGAENINFVTPTHVVFQIIEALCIAIEEGLNLPLVYNCGGYESVDTLKMIEGVFDIYMPDIKYADNKIAKKFSFAPDYWKVVKEATKEMHRQVNDLVIENGIAKRGLLIRHLVLPNRVADSFKILDFIKEEISLHTYINIMEQYYPCYRAYEFKELSRRITLDEYQEVVEYARKIGLYRGF
jgi:putative pyruvate formate lyase activating enzyme